VGIEDFMASIAANGTFSALRDSNFRLYFFGQLVSISGTWMQTVAQGWLVFHLTRSELWLGIVACAAGLPSLFFSPFAGVIVDRVSRRSLLIATQIVYMLLAFVLAALTFANVVQVWHVVALAFVTGVMNAVDAPARQAFVKDMVGSESLTSGIALNAMTFNGARIIGPALAGLLLAQVGAAWCFFFNGVSFFAVLIALLLMSVRVQPGVISNASPLKLMREGLAFSRRHEFILPLLLMSAVACLFVVNLVTLLPSFAAVVLNSPIDAYSALNTAQGIGAVIGGSAVAYLGRQYGRGRVAIFMMLLMSFSAFGLSRVNTVPLAAIWAGIYGLSVVSFFISLNTTIQTIVPDAFRGRVLSLYTLTFMGLSPFGALVLGSVAEHIGTANALSWVAILTGILGIGIVLRWRQVWTLR
jgi:MFS family permease